MWGVSRSAPEGYFWFEPITTWLDRYPTRTLTLYKLIKGITHS